MATITLPIGSGTQQWSPPANCHTLDKIELWGPGGSGGKRTAARVTGGGSGAYVSISGPINVAALLVNGTVPFQTGRGGAAQATANTAGNPGSAKTWFISAATYTADFGLGGLASGTSGATAGGAGGLVANCIPTATAKAGGNGGTESSTGGASGGGASPSTNGNGVSAAAVTTAVAGAGATAPTGGGSGGAGSITTSNATNGVAPGGGGGAHNGATGNSGAGADGQIVLTYTPDPVSSIVVGIANWASSTSYPVVGACAINGGNCYQVATAGTSASSTGPQGAGAGIVDNSVTWNYLCHVDYTNPASWASGIPGSLTQPIVGRVLATAPIAIPLSGSPYFSLTGHGTTPTNTITLTTFPTFGIRDALASLATGGSPFSSGFSSGLGAGLPQQPLALSPNAGVCFIAPNTGSGSVGSAWDIGAWEFKSAAVSVNYFDVTDANIVFDGLQLQDPNPASASSLVKTETAASNFTLRNCILDGYAQPLGATIVDINNQCVVTNNLFVDRQAASGTNPPIALYAGSLSHIVNNTIIRINHDIASTGAISAGAATGTVIRNNAVYGYSSPFTASGTASADHNVTDAATIGSVTNGGNNLLNTTALNQFVGPTTDWRLLVTADCVRAGTPDLTDIPTATDIAGHPRAEWDAGAWALFTVSFAQVSLPSIACSGHAALTAPQDFASAAVSFQLLVAVFNRPWSNDFSMDFGPITSLITLSSSTNASGAFPVVIASHGVVSMGNQASFAGNILTMLCVAGGLLNLRGALTANIDLAVTAFMNLPAVGKAPMPPLVCVAAIQQQSGGGTGTGLAWDIGAWEYVIPLGNSFCVASIPFTVIAALSGGNQANGLSAITTGFLVRLGMEEQVSAAVNIPPLADVATAAQFDRASLAVSFVSLVAIGAIADSCSCRASISPLAAKVTLSQGNLASGIATFAVLATPSPVHSSLLADGTNAVLIADGGGFLLADLAGARNLTEATNASATTSLPPLAAAILSSQSDVATVAVQAVAMATVATAGQSDGAVAAGAVVLGVSIQAGQSDQAHAAATLESLLAVGVAGQSDTASSAVTLALAATGAAQQFDQAHSANNINMAIVATGGPTLIASGTVSLPPLAAVITMANVNGAHGSASIVLAVTGTLTSSTSASAADAVATMAVTASAMLTTPATATVAIPALVAIAAAGQSNVASGISAVVVAGGGVLNNASVSAATLATLPPLAAAGTAQNFVLFASALASIQLGVAATASLNGAQMVGSGMITISAISATGHANLAATLASIAVLAETNATLYVSPTEYETGDQIIYWPA